MRELQYPIQDAYGNVHNNAVVVVHQLSAQNTSVVNLIAKNENGVVSYADSNSYSNKNIGFQVSIYKDMTALTSGKLPIIIKDSSGMDWFNMVVDGDLPSTTQGLVTLVEDYAIDTIIFNMKV